VEITPLQEIERAFERKRLGTAFALPPTLLPVLRDMAGGGARRRALFLAAPLRRRLAAELGIEVTEPVEWGLPAYRSTIQRLARIEIPGTGISGPVSELFVWPRARDYNRSGPGDFEYEDPRWESVIEAPIIDLQGFPSDTLERCIVIAGPGYGKSALLNAVAASLVHTPYVPVLVPLASFAASELGVMEFLATEVNREFDIRVDWLRLASMDWLRFFSTVSTRYRPRDARGYCAVQRRFRRVTLWCRGCSQFETPPCCRVPLTRE
jgi:hypothetical protein